MKIENLCPQCMIENDDNAVVCPYCGYNRNTVQDSIYLSAGTVLKERYFVGKLLKRNIDSAIYIGFDLGDEKIIEIREFLPKGICDRRDDKINLSYTDEYAGVYNEYLQSFLQLWKNLMRFKGLPAIFDVNDVFSLNSTGYAITDHNDSTTFQKILDNGDIESNPLPFKRVKELIVPILSTVESLHTANVVHRGISPDTLVLGSDGKLKITGFAIPQVRSTKNKIMCAVCDGYSAVEQYGFNWQQGAWTDIYSIGALLYKLLTGRTLNSALKRLGDDKVSFTDEEAERIPQSVIELIRKCVAVMPQDRVKSISEIRNVFLPFDAAPKAIPKAPTGNKNVKVRTDESVTPVPKREEAPAQPLRLVKPEQEMPQVQTAQAPTVVLSEQERIEKLRNRQIEYQNEISKRQAAEREKLFEKEKERILRNRTKKKEKRKKQEKKHPLITKIKKLQQKNPAFLGVSVAVIVLVSCVLLVTVMYGTVLYRVVDAPVLDNCLSAFSFLPVNRAENNKDVKMVDVADFSGFTKEYIESNSSYTKKYSIIFEYDFSSDVEIGYVFAQSVPPETQVPVGTQITVYISKGVEMIEFPNVTGYDYDSAYQTLTSLGFAVTAKTAFNNGLHTANTVSACSLNAGEEYPKGTSVEITVWGQPLVPTTSNQESSNSSAPQSGNDVQGPENYGLFSIIRGILGV